MSCPCGSAVAFEMCCGPVLDGTRKAATAEALMRSRYTAYVRGAVDHVIATQSAEGRDGVDQAATESWSKSAEWQGLEIVRTEGGGEDDATGIVEFVARYRLKGQDVRHHEEATFRKDDGVWYFVDGQPPHAKPFRRPVAKVGPNEPCPCGSGSKFKKC